jgi:carboxylesterase
MNQNLEIRLTAGEDAVLLLHGLAGSPLEMRYVANALHRDGFSVAVPHIAGYGYGSPVSHWRDWYASAQDLLQALKREYRTVSVGGLCIGAVLALALAAEQPREIASLSLMSTTLFYDGWGLPWYRFLMPLGFLPPLRWLYTYREREPFGIKNAALRQRIARVMSQGFSEAGAARTTMDHLFHATRLIRHVVGRLGRIETPALVIHAVDDDTASTKSAELVVNRIGSSKVREVYLDDSYHIITMDNERERVARETSSFVREHVTAAPPRKARAQS